MGFEFAGPNSSLSTQAAVGCAAEGPEPSSSTTTESTAGQPGWLKVDTRGEKKQRKSRAHTRMQTCTPAIISDEI